MKLHLIITIIFILTFSSIRIYSQKFRTLEQFQEYFIENSSTIDEIEGIWYVYRTSQSDKRTPITKEFSVAIVKENGEYFQYTIEEGYYKPNPGFKKYNKSNFGYTCIEYDDRCNLTMTSPVFYLSGKKFKYSLDATRYARCVLNSNVFKKVVRKYSYSKLFPLESDIIDNKTQEKIELSTGTGFAISENGLIVTNYHVIEKALSIKIKGVDGVYSKSYAAKVVVSDKNNDLAILKIDDNSFSSFGKIPYILKSSTSNVGEDVFILGYPLRATMGDEIKLTNGIISSRTGFQGDVTSYQVSAPVQPGNSGGPLFDSQGNLIGIINAKHLGAENASYAVKSNYLNNLIELLSSPPKLQTVNSLSGKNLSAQVEIIRKFVYIIETE